MMKPGIMSSHSKSWGLIVLVGFVLLEITNAISALGQQSNPQLQGVHVVEEWEPIWERAWERANYWYRIEAAPTVLHDQSCQGDLGLQGLVKDTVYAVSQERHGDAVRFMGKFQDRSLCLTREGVRGLEFALALFLHRSVISLPPEKAKGAVHGVMNLGMLTFDQLQYTKRSGWLLTVYSDMPRLRPLLASYPNRALGLWIYDSDHGLMVQSSRPDGMDRLVQAMEHPKQFGDGTCPLFQMDKKGFICPSAGDGTGAQAAGSTQGSAPTTTPSGVTMPVSGISCMVESARNSGTRGTLACMNKAIAGLTPSPFVTPSDLLNQTNEQPAIRDKTCTMGQEVGEGTAGTSSGDENNAPTWWDKIVRTVNETIQGMDKFWERVWDSASDHLPPVIDTLWPLAHPNGQGADFERGVLQMQQYRDHIDGAGTEQGNERFFDERRGRVTTEPGATHRTVDGELGGRPRIGGSGGCDKASNAAKRAQALYQCTANQSLIHPTQAWRQPSSSPGGSEVVSAGQSRGTETPTVAPFSQPRTGGGRTGFPPVNPTIALIDPEQQRGAMSGPMSCAAQGGQLVRSSLSDPQCASMRCVEGQACICNRTGQPGGNAGPPRPRGGAGPDCFDAGPCGPGPTLPGGSITPPGSGPVQ